MLCNRVYNSCKILVNVVPTLYNFDILLGVDWLSFHRALIDCKLKRVVFHSYDHLGLIFVGVSVVPPLYLISSMQARRLI